MMEIGLVHFLVVGAAMFCLGVACMLVRPTMIGLMMGVELMVNAANLNFVAFSHHLGNAVDGHVFALFSIILAATAAAVGLAIVFKLFRTFNRRIGVNIVSMLRG